MCFVPCIQCLLMYAIMCAGKSTMPLNSLAYCVKGLREKLNKDCWKLVKFASPSILSHYCATLALLDTFPKGATSEVL